MKRLSIRSILAMLLAVMLPLQGLAFVVQNVAAPGHFHPSALTAGADRGHGHAHDSLHGHEHGHEQGHAHEHGHIPAAPHAHALDDDDVVYVIGEHDPQRSAGFKLPPQDGVARAASLPLVTAPREAGPRVAASTGPLRSRTVEPLRRPPRAG